jgi:hypothetical protein
VAIRPRTGEILWRRTAEEGVRGFVEKPDKQAGSPMTYMFNGKQYIAIAVSGPHLITCAL